MIFNSLEFILFFLIVASVYFSLKRNKPRLILLLIASYFFYGWWDWKFLSLIMVSTLVDFIIGGKLSETTNTQRRKNLVLISLVFNLGLLCVFKYFNFFIDSFQNITSLLGLGYHTSTLKIILPVGISFYTFQTLSYTLDVYRQKIEPDKDFVRFATYVAFFPQLVAGPIVRAADLLPQFKELHQPKKARFISGLNLILLGYCKKIIIADSIAPLVDNGFASPEMFSSINLILIVFFYAIQIYCDFSGYSDIAIGLAHVLGYDFPANFNFPYLARNFSDFWKRWHISLSSWLKDYLYIPLGGNRNGAFKTQRNLMLTMLLGGLWHGANWTFVFWGFLHGFYLILQNAMTPITLILEKHLPRYLFLVLSIITTFTLVCFAWIFFRAQNFDTAFYIIGRILSFDNMNIMSIQMPLTSLQVFLLVAFLAVSEVIHQKYPFDQLIAHRPVLRYFVYSLCLWALLILGTYSSNQFIYFQF